MQRTLALLMVAILGIASPAAALTLDLPHGGVLGDLKAPPGEDITINAGGALVIAGDLTTTAGPDDGPSITIRVLGDLDLTGARIEAGDGQDASSRTGTGTVLALSGG